MTIVRLFCSLMLLGSIAWSQSRPAIQNAAFTVHFADTEKSASYEFGPMINNNQYLFSIRTISVSFVGRSSDTYGLRVACASPNFASAQASLLVHTIPLNRHQPGSSAAQDRFSAVFAGWIPCMASGKFRFEVVRGASGAPADVPFTVSGLIEQLPLLPLR
jgi:hypothetical protein